MKIIVSDAVLIKLNHKHQVSIKEVEECFLNRAGGLLIDTREEHKTQPVTLWFVAATNKNRMLKVIYISDGESVYIKSAYQASPDIIRIYEKYAY
jgi:uncharacterized DUF497 family protein